MNSSSGESGSGDLGRRGHPEWRSGSPEGRPEAWRLILADGSRTAAPGRVEEVSAPPRGGPSAPTAAAGVRPASRGDHGGEYYETLADFLQDEDLTLLDLDLLSSDISLLSAEMVPAEDEALNPPAHASVDESATLSARDLAYVIDAWPHLSPDHRQAILWIAKGGRQTARHGY